MPHGLVRRGSAEENRRRTGVEIGSIIREHRKASAMSQDDLAAKVFVSRQTISSWENGVRQNGLTGFCPAMIH